MLFFLVIEFCLDICVFMNCCKFCKIVFLVLLFMDSFELFLVDDDLGMFVFEGWFFSIFVVLLVFLEIEDGVCDS